jgi:hypothetical protein
VVKPETRTVDLSRALSASPNNHNPRGNTKFTSRIEGQYTKGLLTVIDSNHAKTSRALYVLWDVTSTAYDSALY